DQATVSVVASTSRRQSIEVGMVGYEGMAGIDAVLGTNSALYEYVVQLPDGGHRIKASIIIKEFARGGSLQRLTLSFIRLMMAQARQTAVCNRLHSVEERLARWLLMCHDRASNDDL